MKKKICILVTAAALLASFPRIVSAYNVSLGQRFTVSVGCGAIEGSVKAYASNAKLVSSDTWCDRNKSVSATAVAEGYGTATITFKTVDAANVSNPSNPIDASGRTLGSQSVSVVKPSSSQNSSSTGSQTSGSNSSVSRPSQNTQSSNTASQQQEEEILSSNALLASLSVSEGKLSPSFSSNKTSYELDLSSATESIRIDAKAQDSKASVKGTGEIKVKQGMNTTEIVVTAQDGSEKKYTIKIYVEETPDIFLSYRDQTYGVVKNTDRISAPGTGFEKKSIEIDGKKAEMWSNAVMDIDVLYLSEDKTQTAGFYIYDIEANKIISSFEPIVLLGNSLYLIDIGEEQKEKEHMTFTTVTVDEKEIQGWKYDAPELKNHALLYVMNEKGEKVYYQYESEENTLQLYADLSVIYEKQLETEQKKFYTAAVAAGFFACTAIGALIGCLILYKKRKETSFGFKHFRFKK